MGKINDILTGHRLLEVIDSPVNGKLTVVKELTWGIYIQDMNGLTQSGGVAKTVWKTTLKKIRNNKVNNSLILGLGGGGIAQVINEFWPEAKIVGVDIDKVIVDLGKKYMGLDEKRVGIHIEDAEEFVDKKIKKKEKFDLICVDMYVQDNAPEKFASDEFIRKLKKIMNRNGVVIYNRLFFGEKRPIAHSLWNRLQKHFSNIETVHPEANVMFICHN